MNLYGFELLFPCGKTTGASSGLQILLRLLVENAAEDAPLGTDPTQFPEKNYKLLK